MAERVAVQSPRTGYVHTDGDGFGGLPRWPRNPRTRRLLLGDWHPLLRDPIDLLRAALLVGAALLIILDKNVEAAPLVTVLIVLVPRILDMPRPFDLAVVVAMSIQAWGNLFDFFNRYDWYDTVVHFVVPMLTSASAYIALARLEVLPNPAHRLTLRHETGIFLVTFLLGVGFGALYEVYEFAADGILDSGLQESLQDTNTDLLAGAVGAAFGGALLVGWSRGGWSTLRRVPNHVVEAMVEATPGPPAHPDGFSDVASASASPAEAALTRSSRRPSRSTSSTT